MAYAEKGRKRRIAAIFSMVVVLVFMGIPLWTVVCSFLHERTTHALVVAIYKNDTVAALAALHDGADPGTRQPPNDTPPTLAEFVRQFLRQMRGGKASTPTDIDRYPPMIALAAAKDNTAVVRALLEHGAKPDVHTRYSEDDPDENDVTEGETALMWAAQNDNVAMAKTLLDKGANPNLNDAGRGEAPLLLTTDPTLMEALIAHGADVHIQLQHSKFAGITPLRYVILNILDDEGGTPSHQSAYRCVEILLAHGADINENNGTPDSGYDATAIQMVAQHGEPADVRFVLAKGANPNLRDGIGWDALACAIEDGMEENMRVLLAHGVNPNKRDIDGRTPLFQAVDHGEDEPVKVLIKAGRESERPRQARQNATPIGSEGRQWYGRGDFAGGGCETLN